MRRIVRVLLVLTGGLGWLTAAMPAGAAGPTASEIAFWTEQGRVDRAVDEGLVRRSWVWGPNGQPRTTWSEPYADAPGGWRVVGYTDKGRMEITPGTDASSPWHIVSGLLAMEMTTGRLQLGDTLFPDFAPAVIGVAGDPNDTSGPTYAALGPLRSYRPNPAG